MVVYTTEDDPAAAETDSDEPLTIDELAASVRRVLGADLPMGAPSRLTRFAYQARQAERYRVAALIAGTDVRYPVPGTSPHALAGTFAPDLALHSLTHQRSRCVTLARMDLQEQRRDYFGALAWVTRLMSFVQPNQLDAPTPCEEFTVRALMGMATFQNKPREFRGSSQRCW